MDHVARSVLEEAQMGDVAAFEKIVNAYENRLFTMAFRMLGNRTEAEDAVQETFLRVYTNLPRYDETYQFSTWIYRIATNVCIDSLRKRRPHQSLDVDDGEDGFKEGYERLAGDEKDPLDSVLQTERCADVQRALNALPVTYRTVLILKYIQELSLQEIGDILHVPVTTVKTRIHRGREAMKEQFADVPVS
ncbi:RNA polymerase sigma factor SigW [Ferroacidibacillus organovorans]|uniref:RNA polymerase sigma factor SigW n=1 Tax=Ferroacidibacillus organovorans TaxID=1765683 RepID=A0A101XPQ3_9BACL|nr:RNA polymerase sigma factor SigW [Ferroacidibacillus organovorans]KUO95141.1 hypothetical protein ATW55_13380 [Ferroacidibacillus organovorans]